MFVDGLGGHRPHWRHPPRPLPGGVAPRRVILKRGRGPGGLQESPPWSAPQSRNPPVLPPQASLPGFPVFAYPSRLPSREERHRKSSLSLPRTPRGLGRLALRPNNYLIYWGGVTDFPTRAPYFTLTRRFLMECFEVNFDHCSDGSVNISVYVVYLDSRYSPVRRYRERVFCICYDFDKLIAELPF